MTTTGPTPPTSSAAPGRGPPKSTGLGELAEIPTLGAATLEGIIAETERRKLALEPNTLDEAWWLCDAVAKTRSDGTLGLNLHGCDTPENALARVMTGRALGLPAMQSIEQIHLIWNKSTNTWTTVMSVKAKLALLYRRKDVIEYIRPVTLTNEIATWVGKRRGEGELEFPYTFTIDDARIAGLVDRGATDAAKAGNNYNKHPGPMLQWRACGRLCDIIGADVLLGIATSEELLDDPNFSEAMKEQIRAAAEEVVDRAAKKSLDEKLTAREAARAAPSAATVGTGVVAAAVAPAGAAPATPARDWPAEAAALKEQILASLEPGAPKKLSTAVRAAWEKFKDEAPGDLAREVHRYYSTMRGDKSSEKDKKPPADALPIEAPVKPAPGPDPKPAASPAAAAAPAGPACVVCGKPIARGGAATWIPSANEGNGGWQHPDCRAQAAPVPSPGAMPPGQPSHGFGGPRPAAVPADDVPTDDGQAPPAGWVPSDPALAGAGSPATPPADPTQPPPGAGDAWEPTE